MKELNILSEEELLNEEQLLDGIVNHPSHYNSGNIEVISVIDDWNLDFAVGNAVKYIGRAGHKNDYVEDLEKAKWYLVHYASKLKSSKSKLVKRRVNNKIELFNVIDDWDLDFYTGFALQNIYKACKSNNKTYVIGNICGAAAYIQLRIDRLKNVEKEFLSND